VDDYLRFSQMILDEGKLDGKRILMPATIRFMLMDHLRPDQSAWGLPLGYGLGFVIVRDPVMMGMMSSAGQAEMGGRANTFSWINPKEDLVYMVWAQLEPWGTWDLYKRIHPLVHAARMN
jgi:CubicO group peptidase (beta-lactamase class C family)